MTFFELMETAQAILVSLILTDGSAQAVFCMLLMLSRLLSATCYSNLRHDRNNLSTAHIRAQCFRDTHRTVGLLVGLQNRHNPTGSRQGAVEGCDRAGATFAYIARSSTVSAVRSRMFRRRAW